MTLTDAEKRQLLRERRANKIKNGAASRLNRITGEKPLEKDQQVGEEEEEAPAELNRRISRSFDKPTEQIKSTTTTTTTTTPNLADEEEFELELQKIQAFLHKEQQHDKHGHITPDQTTHIPSAQFNPFDIQSLLGGSGSGSGMPDFNSLIGGGAVPGSSGGVADSEEVEYQQGLKAYKKQENSILKARMIVVKFVFVTLLTVYSFFKYDYQPLDVVSTGLTPSFKLFLLFEIITTFLIFNRLVRVEDDEYDYKYSSYLYYLGFIPDAFLSNGWKNKIRLSVKYLELVQFILFDVALCVVVTGLLSAVC